MTDTHHDIINLASSIKKPSKGAILKIVRDIIVAEKYTLTEFELAQLYSYFIPPIPAKTKNPLLWVGLAAAKVEVRNFLNFSYCDGDRLIGCDGHRVHWVAVSDMEPGYYIPSTLDLIADQGQYPDIDRVIPVTHSADAQVCTLSDFNLVESHYKRLDGKKPVIQLCYDLPNGTRVLKKYVDAAYNRDKTMTVYLPQGDKNMTAIKLESIDGMRHAVIMPIHK